MTPSRTAPKSRTFNVSWARSARLRAVVLPGDVVEAAERSVTAPVLPPTDCTGNAAAKPAMSDGVRVELPAVTWPFAFTVTFVKLPAVVMLARVVVSAPLTPWAGPLTTSPVSVSGWLYLACTNAVVAMEALLSFGGGVGAVGLPEKAGDASEATTIVSALSAPLASLRPVPRVTASGAPGFMLTRPSRAPWASVSFGCRPSCSVATVAARETPDWSSITLSMGWAEVASGNCGRLGMRFLPAPFRGLVIGRYGGIRRRSFFAQAQAQAPGRVSARSAVR